MKPSEHPHLSAVRAALEQKAALSFTYSRADGQVSSHNAVYPTEIFAGRKHTYFKARCYFTRDVRSFRVDRIKSLRSTLKQGPLPRGRPVVIVALLLATLGAYPIWTLTGGDPFGEWVRVTHVTDGDTIGVGRGWRYATVRLIGVDTPETVHPDKPVERYGYEASAFTETVLQGEKVHLDFEQRNLIDRYDRLLAYVFLMDGTHFNAELVRQGLARVVAYQPFRYYRDFKGYEREARRARKGMWSEK